MTISNPINKALKAEIEKIRITATSPNHLITLLQEFWLSLGIRVSFTNYPSHFALSVSNTHNAPKGYQRNWSQTPGYPTGYPGWKGRWEGSVEVLKECTIRKYPDKLSFSSLTPDYVQTGTGCSGPKFYVEGILWVYDFPEMEKQFNSHGGKFKVMTSEYRQLLKNYQDEYRKAQTAFLAENLTYRRCKELQTQLENATFTMDSLSTELTKTLIQQFNDKYERVMPTVHECFAASDQDTIKQVYLETGIKPVVNPKFIDLNKTYIQIESLTKTINDYLDQHPEILFQDIRTS